MNLSAHGSNRSTPPSHDAFLHDGPSAVPEGRILIIEDDVDLYETYEWGLSAHGLTAVFVQTGDAAISKVTEDIRCAVVDYKLPDTTGTELIPHLREQVHNLPVILVSGFLTSQITVEAMKLGAHDVLEKPIDIADLAASISQISLPQHAGSGAAVGRRASAPVAARWAGWVVKACEANDDPRTLEHWARIIGVSYSSLCETCRLLDVRPHDARDFMRIARALVQAPRHKCPPEALLDVSDRRTLSALIERAGVSDRSEFRHYSLALFLIRQNFISGEALREVTTALLPLASQM